MLSKLRLTILLPYLLLAALSLVLIFAVFRQGFYASHDGIFHIYRIEEAWNMLKLGEFPLRWAGNFDQGFGIPLFTFVYPLPYYLGAIIYRFLGSIWAVKILIAGSYLLGGWGMFTLFRKRGIWRALTLALVYLMTPYLFLNIFVRGALGEILALGLIPWVLVSYASLEVKNTRLQWYHPLPLALTLIAHNFLGVLFAGFLLGKIMTMPRNRKLALLSLALSLGLSAFFLIPMFMEKNLLYSFEHHDLTFRYYEHFVYLRQFLYGKWDYWYSVAGPNDGMSFQLGFAQMLLTGLGAISILVNKRRKLADLYLLFAYAGSLFLMTAYSRFIWEKLSLLQSVQFPWRLLFMPAVLTPLIGSNFLDRIKTKQLLLGSSLFILSLNFWNVRNYRRPIRYLNLTEYTDLYRLYFNKTSTTFRTEILPKWSGEAERYKSDELLVNSGNMTVDQLSFGPRTLDTTINNKPDASEGRVSILRNYYPGWHLTMDGKENISIEPGKDGIITFRPVLGIHWYHLSVGETNIELSADIISLFTLLLLLYLGINSLRLRSRHAN